MKQHVGFTYAAKANKALIQVLELYSNHRRFVWNWALRELEKRRAMKAAYDQFIQDHFTTFECEGYEGPEIQPFYIYDFHEISARLTEIKNTTHCWLQDSIGSIQAQALLDLEKSIKAWQKHPQQFGYPKRQKKAFSKKTFRFQLDQRLLIDDTKALNWIDFKNKRIRLPWFYQTPSGKQIKTYPKALQQGDFAKADWIKLQGNRFPSAYPKMVTITLLPTGKIQVSFMAEEEIQALPKTGKAVGLDMGLKVFAMQSDGKVLDSQQYFRKAAKKLANAQRKRTTKTKGSKGDAKAKVHVAKIYARMANQRKNFQHQASTRLIREFDFIGLESLHIAGMVKNHHLAKAILDQGWAGFMDKLAYKAEWHGKWIQEIGRFYPSSQLCCQCHKRHKMPLHQRMMKCECGNVLDRDLNAAKNILQESLRLLKEHVTKVGSGDPGVAVNGQNFFELAQSENHQSPNSCSLHQRSKLTLI